MNENYFHEVDLREIESVKCVRCGRAVLKPLRICGDCHRKQELEDEWYDEV